MSSKLNIEHFLYELYKGLVSINEEFSKEFDNLNKISPPGKYKDLPEKLKAQGMPADKAFKIAWAAKNKDKMKKGPAPIESAGSAGMPSVYGENDSGTSMALKEKGMNKEEVKSNSKLSNKERSAKEDQDIENKLDLIHQKDPEAKGKLPDEESPKSVSRDLDDGSGGVLKKDDIHVPKPKMGLSMPKMPKLPKMPKMPQSPKLQQSLNPKKLGKDELKPGSVLPMKSPSVHLSPVGHHIAKPTKGVKTMVERVASRMPPKLPGMGKKEMQKEEMGFDKLKNKLAHQKGVSNPAALAAAIGRKKLGTAEMSRRASAGKKDKK